MTVNLLNLFDEAERVGAFRVANGTYVVRTHEGYTMVFDKDRHTPARNAMYHLAEETSQFGSTVAIRTLELSRRLEKAFDDERFDAELYFIDNAELPSDKEPDVSPIVQKARQELAEQYAELVEQTNEMYQILTALNLVAETNQAPPQFGDESDTDAQILEGLAAGFGELVDFPTQVVGAVARSVTNVLEQALLAPLLGEPMAATIKRTVNEAIDTYAPEKKSTD